MHAFWYFKLTFTLELLFIYWKLEFPVRLFDLIPIDFFTLWIPESKMICLGSQ